MLKSVITEFNGFKYALLENDAIGNHILKGKKWEPELQVIIEELVTTETDVNVLDLGANFGYHTLNLCRAVPNGKVHSFEPLRIIHQQLNANLFINGFANGITYNKCLGDTPSYVEMEEVNFNDELVNIGNTKIGQKGDKVQMITLDSLNLKNVKFIKVDTQGSEKLVLQGAVNTITESKPIIVIEIEEHHLSCFNTSGNEVLGFIRNIGYSIYRIENDYPCDHLCIPVGSEEILNKLIGKVRLTKV